MIRCQMVNLQRNKLTRLAKISDQQPTKVVNVNVTSTIKHSVYNFDENW